MSGEKEGAVIDYLMEKIRLGTWKIGSRIPSEYMLAEKFGIDKGTANRAVSTLVTKGYLKRTRGPGGTVLLRQSLFPKWRFLYTGVLPTIHSFYAKLTMGLMGSAYAAECSMMLLPLKNVSNFETFEDRLRMLNPDFLFIGGEIPPFQVPDHLPIIAMDSYCMRGRCKNLYLLNPDNYETGRKIMDVVYEKGHRRIAHCFNPSSIIVEKLRVDGAKARAKELGLDLLLLDRRTLSDNPLSFRRYLPELLKNASVIIFENDIYAADFIGMCRRFGVRVPEDISVCSYVSGQEFHHFYKINSMDFLPLELGEYAVSLALQMLNGEKKCSGEELFPVSYFEGETLAEYKTKDRS